MTASFSRTGAAVGAMPASTRLNQAVVGARRAPSSVMPAPTDATRVRVCAMGPRVTTRSARVANERPSMSLTVAALREADAPIRAIRAAVRVKDAGMKLVPAAVHESGAPVGDERGAIGFERVRQSVEQSPVEAMGTRGGETTAVVPKKSARVPPKDARDSARRVRAAGPHPALPRGAGEGGYRRRILIQPARGDPPLCDFATRDEKTVRHNAAIIAIGCAMLWLRV